MTDNLSDVRTFIRTLLNILMKKLSMRSKREFDIYFEISLFQNINPRHYNYWSHICFSQKFCNLKMSLGVSRALRQLKIHSIVLELKNAQRHQDLKIGQDRFPQHQSQWLLRMWGFDWSEWQTFSLNIYHTISVVIRLKDECTFQLSTVKSNGLLYGVKSWKMKIIELFSKSYFSLLDFFISKDSMTTPSIDKSNNQFSGFQSDIILAKYMSGLNSTFLHLDICVWNDRNESVH